MTRPIDPPFASVVVGVDGSPDGEEAVRQGARVAALAGASLEVVHVFEGSSPVSEARRRADRVLDEARRAAHQEEVNPRGSVLVGDPSSLLEEEARRHWADLICVGAGRHAGLGMVTRHILQRTECSVLVSRRPRADRPFPHRVLCAVDGSEGSQEAARQAGAITSLSGGDLRLVHVLAKEGQAESPAGLEHGRSALEQAAEAVRPWGMQGQREMLVGSPGLGVLEVTDRWGADLIVLGSRGLHGLRRLLLGSVSEWVSAHAATSVLVARPRPW
jgi:nucleotide-binding universal stress UspA family protein